MRTAVNLLAMVNIQDVHDPAVLVDPVPRRDSRPVAYAQACRPMRIDRKRGIAKLRHTDGNDLRKPLGNRSSHGWGLAHALGRVRVCLDVRTVLPLKHRPHGAA